MLTKKNMVFALSLLLHLPFIFGCSTNRGEVKSAEIKPIEETKAGTKIAQATFALGCFWHSEEMFLELRGVKDALPGYSGGTEENPTY